MQVVYETQGSEVRVVKNRGKSGYHSAGKIKVNEAGKIITKSDKTKKKTACERMTMQQHN